MKTDLQKLPGVGKATEADLIELGISSIEALKGRDPQQLYDELCIRRGQQMDRCLLYTYRCAVYCAETEHPRAELMLWWNWKDAPRHG